MASVFDFAKKNFGLAPDPKLHFRSTTLTQLYSSTRPIPVTDNAYWSNYYTIFDFPSDVPTLISATELRKTIRDHPDNVANLVKVLTSKLDELVHSKSTRLLLEQKESEDRAQEQTFAGKSATTSGQSFANQLKGLGQKVPSTIFNGAAEIVGVGGTSKASKGPVREILNCVRVLTRVLPFLMEHPNPKDSGLSASGSPESRPDDLESNKLSDRAYWVSQLLWGTEPEARKEHEDGSPALIGHVDPPAPQFVIDEEDEEEEEKLTSEKPAATHHPLASPLRPSGNAQHTNPPVVHQRPLLVTLLESVLDLLFLPGVSIPVAASQASNVRYPIWTGGIGASQIPSDHSQAHNSAKVEVIRLLLVILSKPLYSSPHQYSHASPSIADIIGSVNDQNPYFSILCTPNPVLAHLCTKTPRSLLLALLCSLINTSLVPTKTSLTSSANALSSIASGLGKMAQGKMNFASTPNSINSSSPELSRRDSGTNLSPALGGASTVGVSEGLPGWCAVLLGSLLLPESNPSPESRSSIGHQRTSSNVSGTSLTSPTNQAIDTNGFRMYLSKLHRPADLSFLADHILAILMKPMTVTSQLLSSEAVAANSFTNSLLSYGCGLTETVLLLYFALECNPRLICHLITSKKIVQVMIALTFICLEQKDSAKPKVGLIRLCAISLQLLTSFESKELSLIVNSKIELPVGIRAQYSVPGTMADFLIVSICSIVFTNNSLTKLGSIDTSSENFNTAYTALVLTFTNLSPHLKGLSQLSSTRLSQLFLFLSTPAFLLREEGNVRLLYYVLETFNNIIQYQMSDNPYLIYAIIRAYQRFENLATFTLTDALKDIHRRQQRKQDQSTPQLMSQNSFTGASSETRGRSNVDGDSQYRTSEDRLAGQDFLTKSASRTRVGDGDFEELEPLTEKKRGKMPERRKSANQVTGIMHQSSSLAFQGDPHQSSTSPPEGLGLSNDQSKGSATVTAQSVGINGFVPTEGWVASWRDSLPLDTIQIMLSELKPKVLALSPSLTASASDGVIELLKSATLAGLLPPPANFKPRKFLNNTPGALGWMGSLVWSMIFIRDSNSSGYLVGANVQLFGVKHVPRRSSTGMVVDLLKPFSPFSGGTNSGSSNTSSSATYLNLPERPS